jgi:argininosuccinate lyase
MISLKASAGMVRDLGFRTDRMRAVAAAGHATATDLADWLVTRADVPFREAHHIAGRAVALADSKGAALDELSLEDLQMIDRRITQDALSVLSVEASVAARTSFGGTAPAQVRAAIAAARGSKS